MNRERLTTRRAAPLVIRDEPTANASSVTDAFQRIDDIGQLVDAADLLREVLNLGQNFLEFSRFCRFGRLHHGINGLGMRRVGLLLPSLVGSHDEVLLKWDSGRGAAEDAVAHYLANSMPASDDPLSDQPPKNRE